MSGKQSISAFGFLGLKGLILKKTIYMLVSRRFSHAFRNRFGYRFGIHYPYFALLNMNSLANMPLFEI